MKNKIVGIFVCMLLLASTISVVASIHGNHTSAPDTFTKEDCGCDGPRISDAQSVVGNPFVIDSSIPQSGRPACRTGLPASFSWTDVNSTDWVTPAKDQLSCGSCWDFAALGALEIIIQIREGCADLNLDLSEQYVLSCLSHAGSCARGGSAYSAYRFIKDNSSAGNYCNGIIPEFCFPYQAKDGVACANKSPDWKTFLIPISTYGYWTTNASQQSRNEMKTKIFESGPIVAGIMFTIWNNGQNNIEEWGYRHHNSTEYYLYPGAISGINHLVVIVGWKDDSSITNGGYWIVKNSLGPDWGYQGFFNIEYGSLNIDNSSVVWVDYNPENYSNWVPVVKITSPTNGTVNQPLVFNGSKSLDHEGSITSYAWAFGDGTTDTGMKVSHSFITKGMYYVTLTVTDNASNTANSSVWIAIDTVNHAPKKPTLTGRRIGANGTAYQYTFSSKDPDGDPVYYYLNWGDDYWFGGAAGWSGPYQSGQKVTLGKTYQYEGIYTIRVEAMDKYGAKSDWAIRPVAMPMSDALPGHGFGAGFFERFPSAFPILRHLLGY